MKYYNSKTVKGSNFSEIKTRLTEVLKEEGFGVLTEIDIKETLHKKLGKDIYLTRSWELVIRFMQTKF